MKYKHACTASELHHQSEDYIKLHHDRPYLDITEWDVNDLKAEETYLGLSGSPTKVKVVTNIVFTVKDTRVLEPTDTDIDELMQELIDHHNIG